MDSAGKLYRLGLPQIRRSVVLRHGLAVIFGVLLLIAAKYLFGYLEVVFFSIPLAAVALLTLYLGASAGGLLSLIVGAGIWYFFQEPRESFKLLANIRDTSQLLGFFLASGFIVYLVNMLERTGGRLQSALAEKEVLLKELHHRTKNNLQVVSSLITLQCSRAYDSESIQNMCDDMQSRLKAMALVHEKLYRSTDLAHVNIREYITDLAARIMSGYPGTHEIELTPAVDDIMFPIELVIPCGLIINELMSNSMKYAFPQDRGRIGITMRLSDGMIEFVYEDDGPGLPPELDIGKVKTMGLKLVNTMVRKDLNGSIEVIRGKGCCFKITFPYPGKYPAMKGANI
ncbi:MAG: ATP-binding protein [Nitrospiraceae bacterium]|nr:ATP-binding protein [Nitrospiraceae bacterium]